MALNKEIQCLFYVEIACHNNLNLSFECCIYGAWIDDHDAEYVTLFCVWETMVFLTVLMDDVHWHKKKYQQWFKGLFGFDFYFKPYLSRKNNFLWLSCIHVYFNMILKGTCNNVWRIHMNLQCFSYFCNLSFNIHIGST